MSKPSREAVEHLSDIMVNVFDRRIDTFSHLTGVSAEKAIQIARQILRDFSPDMQAIIDQRRPLVDYEQVGAVLRMWLFGRFKTTVMTEEEATQFDSLLKHEIEGVDK